MSHRYLGRDDDVPQHVDQRAQFCDLLRLVRQRRLLSRPLALRPLDLATNSAGGTNAAVSGDIAPGDERERHLLDLFGNQPVTDGVPPM
jgi:hypothetical protein